jgi:hypothetical protein
MFATEINGCKASFVAPEVETRTYNLDPEALPKSVPANTGWPTPYKGHIGVSLVVARRKLW